MLLGSVKPGEERTKRLSLPANEQSTAVLQNMDLDALTDFPYTWYSQSYIHEKIIENILTSH